MARRVKYDWNYDADNHLYADDASVNYELRGYDGNDRLFGNEGNDLLLGGDGNDRLWGGEGDDDIRGGNGNDYLYIDRGNNSYDGGSGSDIVYFMNVSTYGSNVAGFMWWSHEIEASNVGFSVDLSSGATRSQVSTINGPSAAYSDFWGTNTFANIQTVSMTDHNDVLRDNNGGHFLWGQGGNDLMEGRGGADALHGGDGVDTASYESAGSRISADLLNNAGFFDDAEGDTFDEIENLIGSGFSDFLFGDNNNNRIEGGSGSDTIVGRGGKDTLVGNSGIDTFRYDLMSDSTTSVSGRDSILDFVSGSDKIDLRSLDANSARYLPGNEAFNFIGTDSFDLGVRGQLRYSEVEDSAGVTFNRVEGDVNGDRVADFAIAVYSNGQGLSGVDFYL